MSQLPVADSRFETADVRLDVADGGPAVDVGGGQVGPEFCNLLTVLRDPPGQLVRLLRQFRAGVVVVDVGEQAECPWSMAHEPS